MKASARTTPGSVIPHRVVNHPLPARFIRIPAATSGATTCPPFAGFFAKYFVFVAAVEAQLYWLAVIGVLLSVALRRSSSQQKNLIVRVLRA